MLLYSIRDGFSLFWLKGLWDGVRAIPTVIQERKCLDKDALEILREIESHRPGVIYMIKKRVFQRGVRI